MNSQNLKKFNLPDKPGVYFFLGGRSKEILYIGKATSLKDRVRSYFSGDLGEMRGPKVAQMLKLADSIKWQVTDSVLEALILEAELIKKYQPAYNTREKDDKSYWFVVVTKEDFPRVLTIRGRELDKKIEVARDGRKFSLGHEFKVDKIFGPFPYASELKAAMKIIRRIFPFRDTCLPFIEKTKVVSSEAVRGCFNYQIGFCPGVCIGKISKADYQKIIKCLILFFEGKKDRLVKDLEKRMREAVKKQRFEEAGQFRDQIFALRHIQDVSLLKKNELASSQKTFRLEAYDVSHLSGQANVGAMVVWKNGELNKSEYRLFKLRGATSQKGDDLANLTEILQRRFSHKEWPRPNLIVVDGGQLQLQRAREIFHQLKIKVPVVAVVKNDKHKVREILGDKRVAKLNQEAIIAANADVHRFALAYHRKIMRRMIK